MGVVRRVGVLGRGVLGLRIAAAPGDVRLLVGQVIGNRFQHPRLRKRADHAHRLLVHRAHAHAARGEHAAHVKIVHRVAQIGHLKRVHLPRIGQGKSGLRRSQSFQLQKATSSSFCETAFDTIIARLQYSIK